MIEEQWQPIPSLPTFEASTLGRIRNAKTLHIYAQCWLNGRRTVQIDANNIRTTRFVSSLVYETFRGKQPKNARIHVLNGDERDMRLDNLSCSGKRSRERFVPYTKPRQSFAEVVDSVWRSVLST